MRLLLLISILLSQFAAGVTRWVTNTADSGTGSLRSVINASGHYDRIEFDPTIFATSQVIRLTQIITINTRIRIIGPRNSAGENTVTLTGDRDASGNYSNGDVAVFHVRVPEVTLQYLNLADSGNSLFGAIHINSSGYDLTYRTEINGCHFNGNFAGRYGCAIRAVMEHRLYVLNCSFTNNLAISAGGALSITGGACDISSCTFTGNRTQINTDSWVKGGGGVWFDDCSAFIRTSVFEGNQTPAGGGAIKAEIRPVWVEKSTFIGNSGEEGGALHVHEETPDSQDPTFVTNSTFSGNTSAGPGAAFYAAGSFYARIIHCTITSNICNRDGKNTDAGAFHATHDCTANINFESCIVAKNTDSRTAGLKTPDVVAGGATIESNKGNVIGDQTGSGTAFAEAGDRAGSSASPLDPGLLPLADNGGGTPTHEPHPLSVAVDWVEKPYLGIDQRGVPRPSGAARDAGAVERSVISYASWASVNLSSYAAEERDQIDDPDRDGIANALEFLQGTDPSSPSASNARLLLEDGQPFYAFSVSKSASVGEIAARLGESPDLTEWTYTPLLGNASAIPDGSSGALHHYRIRPPAGEPRWFFRLASGN